MEDRVGALEQTVDELKVLVAGLEQRLLAVERGAAGAASPHPATVPTAGIPGPARALDLVGVFTLIGRLFIVLGGAYLLRAETEAGAFTLFGGVVAGLVYAVVWIAAADRTAAGSRTWSAVFHVLAVVLVGFPLIWEATIRFKVITPSGGAAVLAVFTAAALMVAWRRRLHLTAWVTLVGTLATCFALIGGTGQVVPFALLLIALGITTLWMGYSLGWVGLRWLAAAAVDVVVSALTVRALAPEPLDSVVVTFAVQVLLLAMYLGSIGVRTILRQRNVVPFEVVQSAAVLLVGFGGAVSVAQATGAGVGLIGGVFLGFGVASYAVAFIFFDRQPRLPRNVYFYTSVAIVFILAGTALLWGTGAQAAIWAVLAVTGCVMWARVRRLFLLIHGAVYLAAAGFATGVFGYGSAALMGQPSHPWAWPTGPHAMIVVVGVLCAWWASVQGFPESRAIAHAPRVLIMFTLVWTTGGEVIGLLAPVVAGNPGGVVDPGVLATIRTSVLSVAALAVAWIGRSDRFTEWAWLVYPLLVAIGVKMLVEDFSVSRPATLFVAMALYGAALIIAPRLRRAPSRPAPAQPPVAGVPSATGPASALPEGTTATRTRVLPAPADIMNEGPGS